MSGETTLRNRAFKKNLDTFKLLVTYDEFQKVVEQARKELNKNLGSPDFGGVLSDLNMAILKTFNLPFHFGLALSSYLQSGEIDQKFIPDRNYFFQYRPSPLKLSMDLRPLERVWEVHLITYSQLTENELELAFKSLKREQKKSFPNTKLFKRTKSHKNIDQELEIERRGLKRRPAKIIEEYTSDYSAMQKQRLDRGQISKKEFKKILKNNPHGVRKTRDRGYAAKGIAKDLKLTIKPNTVRHIIKRLKKERQDRFSTQEDKK